MPRSVRGLGEEHDAAGLQSKRICSAFSGHAAPLRGPLASSLTFGCSRDLVSTPWVSPGGGGAYEGRDSDSARFIASAGVAAGSVSPEDFGGALVVAATLDSSRS